MQQDAPTPDRKQLVKMGIDLAPLLVFFAVYMIHGIYWATGALMVATVASMIASWLLVGHISATLIVTTALVVGFGALTLSFNDPRFIKMKPTIVNLLFAGFLFGGLLLKRPVLQYILGEALRLTDVGWRKLSLRWACFFLAMAALNEIVWRNFSEATWASFKVFGILPLTLGFAVLQLGLMRRYEEVPSRQPGGGSVPPA
jgi:intracellular septation protein